DKTFDEVKQAQGVTMGTNGAQAARARDIYHDNQQLLRKELRTNADLRTLIDLYNPQRPGFFTAFINGKRYNKLVFSLDPLGNGGLAPEEVMLFSYGESDGGWWTSFHLAEEYQNGTANSSQDTRLYDISHHEIDATIAGTKLSATDQVTIRALVPGTRVLPFDLFGTLRVASVLDEQGRPLTFIQENKDRDSDFAVILPQGLAANQTLKLTVQYAGEGALRDSGGGNFILLPRSTWYPNGGGAFGDRATFNVTYHYPKNSMLVGTGALAEPETVDGDQKVAKWTSGQTELAVAGFNFGRFKKKEVADKTTGLNIEFYANTEVPDEVRQMQTAIEQAEANGEKTGTTLGVISTTKMGDQAIADAENATRLYSAYFGKTPYARLAMTQQPAIGFGQAWPTLVFMPYTAFMDSTQRVQMLGIRGGTDNFWRYVGPHEVAHQWWGHTVGWSSYRDQWMSEGFAEFSASLYVQFIRHDPDNFVEFWEELRKQIVEATNATKGIKPYTIG
ncbi:MAG TPA: M1 family aminopeptidase, partial [Pyrinomonadaceae bacterium]|nr:M1 family aminopeptidase [Pyrinomonadaceae bacterium]